VRRCVLYETMRFSVRHDTLYRYSAPVGLAPHLLRLTPRAERVRMLASELTVEPMPAARRETVDRFGNRITEGTFDGPSDLLRVESSFDLEISAPPPLQESGLPRLPWSCRPQDVAADYWREERQDPAVQNFAETLAAESGWAAVPFLEHLSQTLFRRHRSSAGAHARHWPRRLPRFDRAVHGGLPQPRHRRPFRQRLSGPCRDRGRQSSSACLAGGVAAGRGMAPLRSAHGTAVTDGHVALCAAPDQAATMPIEGGFYGDGVTATLDYRVRIATPGA
jgi:Bacterial transglutaminase-like N-terminal region